MIYLLYSLLTLIYLALGVGLADSLSSPFTTYEHGTETLVPNVRVALVLGLVWPVTIVGLVLFVALGSLTRYIYFGMRDALKRLRAKL